MSGSLESRVERRFMEIEQKLHGNVKLQDNPPVPLRTNYIEEKIERYQKALEEALRNAPCGGCKKLVLGALTGLYIFKVMDSSDRKRSDISDEEIERIKKQVEQKYADLMR